MAQKLYISIFLSLDIWDRANHYTVTQNPLSLTILYHPKNR